jgi:hypothetical protein
MTNQAEQLSGQHSQLAHSIAMRLKDAWELSSRVGGIGWQEFRHRLSEK